MSVESTGLSGGTRPPDAFAARRDAALHLIMLLAGFFLFTACHNTPKAPAYEPLVARLYLEARAGEAGVELRLPVSGVAITVAAKPVITEADVRGAEVARAELGACLLLQVTPAAARDLYRLSVAGLGRRLVLMLNGAPLGVHRLDRALADGTIAVFVERPDAELPALVERVRRTSGDIAAAAAKSR